MLVTVAHAAHQSSAELRRHRRLRHGHGERTAPSPLPALPQLSTPQIGVTRFRPHRLRPRSSGQRRRQPHGHRQRFLHVQNRRVNGAYDVTDPHAADRSEPALHRHQRLRHCHCQRHRHRRKLRPELHHRRQQSTAWSAPACVLQDNKARQLRRSPVPTSAFTFTNPGSHWRYLCRQHRYATLEPRRRPARLRQAQAPALQLLT